MPDCLVSLPYQGKFSLSSTPQAHAMLLHGILLVFFLFGPHTVRVKKLTPDLRIWCSGHDQTRQGRSRSERGSKGGSRCSPSPLASDSARNRGEQAGGRVSASSAWLQLLWLLWLL